MAQLKAETLGRVDVATLAQTIALLAIITFLPFFLHIQWLTGPFVNALLILILFLGGIRAAVIASVIPSLMALSGGLLPAVLAPVVPFIMISNILFIFIIDYIYQNVTDNFKGYWYGIITAAAVKFIFLFISVNFITKLLLKKELAGVVTQMMSWPQFVTAVLGGVIAWVFLKWLKFF
jgi:hypothetical protein